MSVYEKDNGWMINGLYCEMVYDDFVDYKQSSKTTIRFNVGDIYTRKKGYGWQRKITGFSWVDDHLYIRYVEHLGDFEWGTERNCSPSALRKWGEK